MPPLLLFEELVFAFDAEADFLSFDAEADLAAVAFDELFAFDSAEDLADADLACDPLAFEALDFELADFGLDDFALEDFELADLDFVADFDSVASAALSTISLTAPIAALTPPIAAPVAASTRTSPTTSLALSKIPGDELFLLVFFALLFALLLFAPAEDSASFGFIVLLADLSLDDFALSFFVGISFSSLFFIVKA
ncbi:MAG TPA: hypothetical protein VF556_07135 [Pyrinomonadaceae bacterium]